MTWDFARLNFTLESGLTCLDLVFENELVSGTMTRPTSEIPLRVVSTFSGPSCGSGLC